MPVDRTLLEEYRIATEALLDAITVFQTRLHTHDGAEYMRLEQLVETRQEKLDSVRREFENPEELKRSG